MLKVGLTGGIACGKTVVAEIMARCGATVIQADDVARRVMARGTGVYKDVVAYFGKDILDAEGEIDRRRLAEIVFTDENERRLLNNLTHPLIIKVIKKELAASKKNTLVVVEVPLLIEADMVGLFDKIVVVAATPDQQFSRLLAKGYSEVDAVRRLRAQISNAERFRYADFILLNKGSLINLKQQVENLMEKLRRND